jgi:hypothetical protein
MQTWQTAGTNQTWSDDCNNRRIPGDPRMTPITATRTALLALAPLMGCAGGPHVLFETPVVSETLDGDYRTLAACTFQRLARRDAQLQKIVVPDQPVVRISPADGAWVLSFINEEAGRSTRMEMKSPGMPASDYALAIARACSA